MLEAVWHVTCQLAPWLLLGMFLSGLIHVLLPAGFVHRRLRGRRGVLQAVALGVPLPLCSCGVVPAGIGLKRDGASDGAAVGFLISTPQTGVDSILVSASFLGWPFAIFKVGAAAVTGVIGGWLADGGAAQREANDGGSQGTPPAVQRRSLREMFNHALEILESIWVWLLIGVVVSAAIGEYVPAEWMADRFQGGGRLLAALLTLLLSLPLYVCATASVPIAAALVAAGFPAGAALVFLMAGPATNVTTIGAVYQEFGRRTLAVYLITIIAGSLLFGWLFDWILPASVSERAVDLHHHVNWWSQWSAALLLALIGWCIVRQSRYRWTARQARRAHPAGTGPGLRVEVQGMTCQNCVQRLESALRRTPGVSNAEVNLPGEAVVRGEIRPPELQRVIAECGFQAGLPHPAEADAANDG